jgi:hypothetical protein
MEVDARLSCYVVKLDTVGVCDVRAVTKGLSLHFLLLLGGVQAMANQSRGEIARSEKEHRC